MIMKLYLANVEFLYQTNSLKNTYINGDIVLLKTGHVMYSENGIFSNISSPLLRIVKYDLNEVLSINWI